MTSDPDLFDIYYNDPDQFHKIFTELGYSLVVDNCDGYCPDCEFKSTCEVYPEMKDEWDSLYE